MDDREEMEENYEEPRDEVNGQDDDGEENAKDPLAAAGLEDSDAEDEVIQFFVSIFCITF